MRVLIDPPAPVALADIGEWKRARTAGAAQPTVERALEAGFRADRVGYAFASGYAIALERLVPQLRGVGSLAVTEATGAHPKQIATSYRSGVLGGTKTFATLAPIADAAVVIAKTDAGALVAVKVPLPHPKITLRALPHTPFAPEVPHAELVIDALADGELLPGDGYDTYTKPFRTIEDLHVHAALAGYVIQVARRCSFDRAIVEDLLAGAAALVAIAERPPLDPTAHVMLAGALRQLRVTLDRAEPEWQKAEPEVRARWDRDRPLLQIAEGVRAKRTQAAWEKLAADVRTAIGSPPSSGT